MVDASAQVAQLIAQTAGWRGEMLARIREAIGSADARLVEEWKWKTPVWTCGGNVVAMAAFKNHVKINFFRGAALDDPKGLFNAGLDAKDTRGIDLHEGDKLDVPALKKLVKAAIELNNSAA